MAVMWPPSLAPSVPADAPISGRRAVVIVVGNHRAPIFWFYSFPTSSSSGSSSSGSSLSCSLFESFGEGVEKSGGVADAKSRAKLAGGVDWVRAKVREADCHARAGGLIKIAPTLGLLGRHRRKAELPCD